MFDKLLEQIEQKKAQIQKDLNNIVVEADAEGGLVKVKASGNKKILSIEIDDSLLKDKETLEDLVIVAVNKAIEKSEAVYEKQMASIAGDMVPGMKNMFGM